MLAALIVAGLFGGMFQSWTVFVIATVVLLVAAWMAGHIRPARPPRPPRPPGHNPRRGPRRR